MKAGFALIHSPLVGPGMWSPIADELVRRGHAVVVPNLDGDESSGEELWRQHVRAAASRVRDVDRPILVGHSAAGALLPAIREAARAPVSGYIFMDAGLPSTGPRRGSGAFAKLIDDFYAAGQRFPNWTDEDLRAIVPDDGRRRALLQQMRPAPSRFWTEAVPLFPGWPDAPCAYLRFAPNPVYDEAAAEATRRGWPHREISGGHFHMLVDPPAVTDALIALANSM